MALMSLMSTSFPLVEFHPVQQLLTSCQLKTDIFFMMGGQLLLLNSVLQLAGSWIGCLSLKRPCLLFAHNAKLFDAKYLQRALEKSNQITRFQEFVPGFCDTLPAFKEVLPNRKSYSQENLAKHLLQATYSAHNALSDVRMLQELCNNFLNIKVVEKHGFSFFWLRKYIQFLNQKRRNLQTLQPLINAKAISKGIAEKAARSGLSLAHLVLAFKRGGYEGLTNVLKEKFNGKARVTKKREII
ncbi:uncharacterized protein LOC122947649 [Acropora millepora]|uniref:uncharacterized protein LOC122947649 n=1 Tax=Acropora millepora TaxID=45264 RepID=UPI001CF1F680|nr:uncharacterized protein LOC122947649 [Acropora millepora]